MYKVKERKMIVPNIHLLTIEVPEIAQKIQPGQFIMVMSDEKSERIPLTIADWDKETITTVFMEAGISTYKLAQLKEGDILPVVVGPLGKPLEIPEEKTVLCVGGCYGIADIYPLGRALKEKGNRVISLIEARSKFLLYWQERLSTVSDELVITTADGSMGKKGHTWKIIRELIEKNSPLYKIFAIGCILMMKECSQVTQDLFLPIMVALNPIMVDGTGMCGACRVSVEGKTQFACVDGPNFDGHKVDWVLLYQRRKAYKKEECYATHRHLF